MFAEAVTLAHLARPLALSEALPAEEWCVTLACDPRYRQFLTGFRGSHQEIASIDPAIFLDALRRGRPVYNAPTLERYVSEDLAVISAVEPDLIVGDFRLSLSVSARLARVPYVTLSNAYWSPFYEPGQWPVPELPVTRALPIGMAKLLFQLARPFAFAWHSQPLNQVRRRHGLTGLGWDLRRAYVDADYVAYVDAPELFPISRLPPDHQFIGPVLWEPPSTLPRWWDELPDDRPLLYVTLGSSGHASLLPRVIEALGALDVSVALATAGRRAPQDLPSNIHAAGFLPGTRAAERARLVICNGGSLTCYQALSAGVPVIGIASNLDQYLNMQAIERARAGSTVRADRATVSKIRARVIEMLRNPVYVESAAKFSGIAGRYHAPRRFVTLLNHLLGIPATPLARESIEPRVQ